MWLNLHKYWHGLLSHTITHHLRGPSWLLLEMHRKHWRMNTSSIYLSRWSAKIRCCHFRNNILLMWYEVFLTLLVLIVWVGLFISGILRIALCVFCVCYLAATLWQTIGGPVSQSLSAFGFKGDSRWRRPSSRPSPESFLVLVGLSVSLPWLCFNMLVELDSCKHLYKTDVVLNKQKKRTVYNHGEEKMCLFVCKWGTFRIKVDDYYLLHCV